MSDVGRGEPEGRGRGEGRSLPPTLARWAEPLACLDPVLAQALGPLLVRLAAALGPLGGERRKGGDEPDGYAGITRRGKLEHLLTTEWGLLDTAPDEFLRRLSVGELAFLEPERKANAQERHCLVLFDCGPEQLGAPRLAQLAAWIVLTQRTRAVGATLHGASLTSEPSQSALSTGFDEATVRAFLAARTATQATPRQLYDWRKFAQATLGSPDELWLLGGTHWLTIPMARGIHLLSIEETEDGDALALTLRPANKKLLLALPPPDVQVRLLRDPFTPISGKPGQSRNSHRQATGALVWLPGAKFVCARDSADTGILVYPIPHKAGASLGPPKLYQQHHGRIRGVGSWRNVIFGVTRQGNELHLRVLKGVIGQASSIPVGSAPLDADSSKLLQEAASELVPTVLQTDGDLPRVSLRFPSLEKTLSLVSLQPGKLEVTWQTTYQAIATLSAPHTTSVLVQQLGEKSYLVDTRNPTATVTQNKCLGPIGAARLFVGPSLAESVVVQRSDGLWYLPLASKDLAFPALDPDDTLLGATYFGGQVRLVTLSEAGRIVRLVGLGGTKTITGIGGKLVSAALSPDLPLLAALRESGDLIVWDLETNVRRCQFHAPRETFEEAEAGI
jgi:hypothetical protein